MKLDKAIALMLEGKVMVDSDGEFHRITIGQYARIEFKGLRESRWYERGFLCLDGWREATPQELKEIGL